MWIFETKTIIYKDEATYHIYTLIYRYTFYELNRNVQLYIEVFCVLNQWVYVEVATLQYIHIKSTAVLQSIKNKDTRTVNILEWLVDIHIVIT